MEKEIPDFNDIIFYSSPEGSIKIDVIYQDETFGLTQKRMAELFGIERALLLII